MEKNYEVITIDVMTRPSDLGGVEKFYRIRYRTKGGVVDFTDIDEANYTEEKVTAKLTKLAEKHDKIKAS